MLTNQKQVLKMCYQWAVSKNCLRKDKQFWELHLGMDGFTFFLSCFRNSKSRNKPFLKTWEECLIFPEWLYKALRFMSKTFPPHSTKWCTAIPHFLRCWPAERVDISWAKVKPAVGFRDTVCFNLRLKMGGGGGLLKGRRFFGRGPCKRCLNMLHFYRSCCRRHRRRLSSLPYGTREEETGKEEKENDIPNVSFGSTFRLCWIFILFIYAKTKLSYEPSPLLFLSLIDLVDRLGWSLFLIGIRIVMLQVCKCY